MTATAPATDQAQRIDKFIATQMAKAAEPETKAIRQSGARAALLGFSSSANVQYGEFLAAFAPTKAHEDYGRLYPNCVFLTWNAFHYTRKALRLWCDMPGFYAGGIPDSQLGYIEEFEKNMDDNPRETDLLHMLEIRIKRDMPVKWNMQQAEYLRAAMGYYDSASNPETKAVHRAVDLFARQARESLFVLAPPEAFTTHSGGNDWLARFKNCVTHPEVQPTRPPNDPLVVSFVDGGVLVVASWGDEAARLNEKLREVNGG